MTSIRILYDNQALPGFHSGWGFAALINDTTLFDTGESFAPLRNNLQRLDGNPQLIRRIVLSHSDWDHVGGIEILRYCGNVEVHFPESFSPEMRRSIQSFNSAARLVPVSAHERIAEDLTVVAHLDGHKPEISLVVKTPAGPVLLTGCAHPGLARIISSASEPDGLHAVLGGFHDFNDPDALETVPRIFPCHCTRHAADILSRFPDRSSFVAAGTVITFDSKDSARRKTCTGQTRFR